MLNRIYQTSERKIVYRAPLLSCATLLWLVFIFCLLLLPFVFSYSATSLWPKENSFREQPLVQHTKKCLIYLQGTSATDGVPFEINFGSDPNYQKYMGRSARTVTVSVLRHNNIRHQT
jgi:hypothetical protein